MIVDQVVPVCASEILIATRPIPFPFSSTTRPLTEAGAAEGVSTEVEEAEPAEAEASEPEAEEEAEEAEAAAEEEDGYELKPIDIWAIDLANRVSIGLNGVLTAPADPVLFSLEGDEVFADLWMPAVTGRVMGFFAGLCQMPYRAMMGAFDAAFATT